MADAKAWDAKYAKPLNFLKIIPFLMFEFGVGEANPTIQLFFSFISKVNIPE